VRTVLQAIHDAAEKRDSSSVWASRQSAYNRLTPLVWKQLLTQAEQIYKQIDICHGAGLFDVSDIRKDEFINGQLQLRVNSRVNSPTGGQRQEQDTWQDQFCAISSNLFLIYADEYTPTPEELICLQFATITANSDWLHAFTIKTPIRTIELRATDDAELDKWCDAIFALQSTESFARLVPQGMRKQHLLSRLRAKGGEMAVRLLRRNKNGSRYLVIDNTSASNSFQQVGEGLELSAMLKDPTLGILIRSYAEENGAGADLQLYANVNDIVGVDHVEILETRQVELLQQCEHRQILRLSQTCLQNAPSEDLAHAVSGAASSSDSSIMQTAYEQASRRLISELLPRFCETEGFKSWLVQQQEDERSELHLLATLQSPAGSEALRGHLRGRPEEQILTATIRIEELLMTSTMDTPHLQLAQLLIKEHFSSGSQMVSSEESSVEALTSTIRAWAANVTDEGLRRAALSAFNQVMVVDLRPQLQLAFVELKASSGYSRVIEEMAQREPAIKTNIVHWIHLPQGFAPMREWMAGMRAAENLEFIAEVIKFKNLDDIELTKDTATRINSKFIAEGAVAQVCLSRDAIQQIQVGLRPRYASHLLFDDAAEHVIRFMQQDLWASFMLTGAYQRAAPLVHAALGLGNLKPLLLSIRWVESLVRQVIVLSKRVVTIGSSNCDILITKAAKFTSVLRIELAPDGDACYVSMLWTTTPRSRSSIAQSTLSDSKKSVASTAVLERTRAAVIAELMPRRVKHGDVFLLGDIEAMLLPLPSSSSQ
jgi:hypothetical protein